MNPPLEITAESFSHGMIQILPADPGTRHPRAILKTMIGSRILVTPGEVHLFGFGGIEHVLKRFHERTLINPHQGARLSIEGDYLAVGLQLGGGKSTTFRLVYVKTEYDLGHLELFVREGNRIAELALHDGQSAA